MSRGVQLRDLFDCLPPEEAQRELYHELETMRSLCLKLLRKRRSRSSADHAAHRPYRNKFCLAAGSACGFVFLKNGLNTLPELQQYVIVSQAVWNLEGMTPLLIQNWQDVELIHSKLRAVPSARWIFRGLRDFDWELQPKLERALQDRFKIALTEAETTERRLIRNCQAPPPQVYPRPP